MVTKWHAQTIVQSTECWMSDILLNGGQNPLLHYRLLYILTGVKRSWLCLTQATSSVVLIFLYNILTSEQGKH